MINSKLPRFIGAVCLLTLLFLVMIQIAALFQQALPGFSETAEAAVQDQSGFSVSTDWGASYEDRGAFGNGNRGDPSLVWRRHGDYDQNAQYQGNAYIGWADDRNMQGGHNDPDIWGDVVSLGPPTAVLTITKSQPVGILAVGETITYTISVTNSGGLTATNVVMSDNLNGTVVEVGGPDMIAPYSTAIYIFSWIIQQTDCNTLNNIAFVYSKQTGTVTMNEPVVTELDCINLYLPVVLKAE